jgi:hypothetical protein
MNSGEYVTSWRTNERRRWQYQWFVISLSLASLSTKAPAIRGEAPHLTGISRNRTFPALPVNGDSWSETVATKRRLGTAAIFSLLTDTGKITEYPAVLEILSYAIRRGLDSAERVACAYKTPTARQRSDPPRLCRKGRLSRAYCGGRFRARHAPSWRSHRSQDFSGRLPMNQIQRQAPLEKRIGLEATQYGHALAASATGAQFLSQRLLNAKFDVSISL